MLSVHEGGCLCGDVRYRTTANPMRVTVCHCTFCQKLTGSAYLVEPIFRRADVTLTGAAPKTYDHRSDTSHKRVTINFCERCGTTVYLDLGTVSRHPRPLRGHIRRSQLVRSKVRVWPARPDG